MKTVVWDKETISTWILTTKKIMQYKRPSNINKRYAMKQISNK